MLRSRLGIVSIGLLLMGSAGWANPKDASTPRVVTVDMRTQSQESAYYVVFFRKNPWPGHAFVGLGTEDPLAAQSK